MSSDQSIYEELLDEAIETIKTSVSYNEEFESKSLFIGTRWNDLKRGVKTHFGVFFSEKVKQGQIPEVIFARKNNNNHSIYKKVKVEEETK